MKNSALCLTIACAFAILSAHVNRAVALQFYAVSHANRSLYRIDSENLGAATLVGPITTGTNLNEIVNLGAAGLLTFDSDSNQVITLNPADASVQAVASMDVDIAVQPRGF